MILGMIFKRLDHEKAPWLVLWCLLAGTVAGGCQFHRPAGGDLLAGGDEIVGENYPLAWQAVLEVLRDHNFEPDRQDMRFGIITTEATISGQFFEFWRADAQSWYQWAESSVHTIRRSVIARFDRQDGSKGSYVLTLEVKVQRKFMPQRQITTAGQALHMFGEKLPIYTGERIEADQGVRWVELGSDQLLEQYLLDRIARKLPEGQLRFSSRPS